MTVSLDSVSIEFFLCFLTATRAHLLMSLGHLISPISRPPSIGEGFAKIIYISPQELLRRSLSLCFRDTKCCSPRWRFVLEQINKPTALGSAYDSTSPTP